MAEYTREWKFRAWDPEAKKMYSPEDLEEPDTDEEAPKTIYGQLIDGELVINDIKTNPASVLYPMQCTNWFDAEQNEVFEGDIVEIDGKISQVIWDEDIAGYLFLSEDGELYPGGAYLTDALKIVGNVYENGNADPVERKRQLKYRAWDPEARFMHMPEDIKDPQTDFTMSLYAYLSFGALYIYDFKNDPPMELIPMQYTGWFDSKDVEICEGDVVKLGDDEESIAQIAWSDEIGQFILISRDGTIYPGSRNIAAQTEIIGDIYRNADLVPQL